ncbi:ABC transporter substrate-binding protein [Christensenellaceae bacterium OttesenSCG-928-M15]|nr:ABC transporter substrate-binding protein [Christensenellaceae bacterium OttesenSCG-928-M15]
MKKIFALLLVVLLLLPVVACQQNSPAPSDDQNSNAAQPGTAAPSALATGRDSVVIAVRSATENFDPQNHLDLYSYITDVQIYDALEYINFTTGEFELKLAESIEISADATKATVKLKEGVYFHNGEELKASDVKFTYDRAMASPLYGSRVGMLKECNIIDEYTVEIVCGYPYAPMDVFLGGVFIVNEKAVTQMGDAYGNSIENIVGTGAYKLVSWDKGQSVKLTRNDDYFGEKAHIKDITIKCLTSTDTATIALEKGDVDYIYESDMNQLQSLEANDKLAITSGPMACVEMLSMNIDKAPFNDINIRKAVAHAISRDSIAIVAGLGDPFTHYLDSLSFGFAQDVTAPEKDIEKGKEYMAQAGYPNGGLSISFIAFEGQGSPDFAAVLQSDLAQIGIDMKIEIMEFNTGVDKLFAGDYELSSLALSNRYLDADFFYQWYTSTASNNFFFFKNDEFDTLVTEGRSEIDPGKREEIYHRAQEILRDEVAYAPLYQFVTVSPHNKELHGVEIPTILACEFRKLYWD